MRIGPVLVEKLPTGRYVVLCTQCGVEFDYTANLIEAKDSVIRHLKQCKGTTDGGQADS